MLTCLSFLREPVGLDDVDADIPIPAARKRHPAPPRNSKEAERAAKKARLATRKTAASEISRSAVDREVVGGDRVQPVDPIAPSPPRTSDPISAPIMTTTPSVMTTTSPIVM